MSTYSQLLPSTPTFTEKNLVDLSGKVYIITGATSGVGLALAKILYAHHSTVYIGGRSHASYTTATQAITPECTGSKGTLKPFIADLASLKSVKPAVDVFLHDEFKLDVLFLNAGVMTPPAGSKTEDGFDLELGVNCLAPFLLTTLLLPLMQNVSRHFCHPNSSIRVVWVSSMLNLGTPDGGVQLLSSSTLTSDRPSSPCLNSSTAPRPTITTGTASWIPKQLSGMEHYMQSKAGVYLLAQEFAHRSPQPTATSSSPSLTQNPHGVLHVSLNPGFLKTNLQRNAPPPMRGIMGAMFKGPKHGAYTELYAGLFPDVQQGDFIIPWGRNGSVPEHVSASTKATEEGSKSVGARFYDWCEVQVKPYM